MEASECGGGGSLVGVPASTRGQVGSGGSGANVSNTCYPRTNHYSV